MVIAQLPFCWKWTSVTKISKYGQNEYSRALNASYTFQPLMGFWWSPIRSVIIRVINKIGRPRSGSPICLITSMITDRIGRHEVLLLINHNFNKICDIIGYFLDQNTRNSTFRLASIEKKSHLSACLMARTVQLLRHDTYCPIKLSN